MQLTPPECAPAPAAPRPVPLLQAANLTPRCRPIVYNAAAMAAPSTTADSVPLRALAIVGVGLIGGSIAAAVKQRGLAERVIGIGRRIERMQAAERAGLIDEAAADPGAARHADLIIVCTPVDRIAGDVVRLAELAAPGAVLTDVGSVKASICAALRGRLPEGIAFVGSHPLAGSEKAGFEHADPDLFDGCVCVMTPDDAPSPGAVARVRDFWTALGMHVLTMRPEEHDQILALTSHLPHAVAAALASLIAPHEARFAASGFRDTTRVASGDPELWAAIFDANAGPLVGQIDRLLERLHAYRRALQAHDLEKLKELLRDSKHRRDALPE